MDTIQAVGIEERARGEISERLAERIGASIGPRTVFGDAVERDGVTVIPVARATWGFGGGSGHRRDGSGGGGGGGGGAVVEPVGFIELSGGNARYRPIWTPSMLVGLLAMGATFLLLARRSQR